jgi:hypothetical protein
VSGGGPLDVAPWQAGAGLLLVFVLPGFAMARALFPEWRFRGELGLTRAVETVTLTLVLSVSTTILVGFMLLNSSAGFSAVWSDPLLQITLVSITAVCAGLAWGRGAFSHVPPAGPVPEPLGGEVGGAERLAMAEHLARRSRRVRHQIRARPSPSELARLEAELSLLDEEARQMGEAREAEYLG